MMPLPIKGQILHTRFCHRRWAAQAAALDKWETLRPSTRMCSPRLVPTKCPATVGWQTTDRRMATWKLGSCLVGGHPRILADILYRGITPTNVETQLVRGGVDPRNTAGGNDGERGTEVDVTIARNAIGIVRSRMPH